MDTIMNTATRLLGSVTPHQSNKIKDILSTSLMGEKRRFTPAVLTTASILVV
jgi:hypothetical protein